jgi:cleavage and polyadenylation specificity factor subunit 4
MRDSCKKGNKCEFMHHFDEARVPVCRFYQQHGECQKGENCLYKHPKPEEFNPLIVGPRDITGGPGNKK